MERSLEDSIKNKTYIDNLRSAAKYSKEVIDLVEADIEYGLTMEQTKLYLKRDIKFPQMKLPSFTGSYADWAKTLIYLCEMTFTIAMTVGSVKGAQSLTSKALGL